MKSPVQDTDGKPVDPKDAVIAKLTEMFPDGKLADPEVHPQIFASQVRMAKYAIFLETPPSTEIVIEGEPEDHGL
jgi:hypothetical protein